MGRKKSKSIQKSFAQMFPVELCQAFESLVKPEISAIILMTQKSGATIALNSITEDRWYIASCWIAYKRFPIIDINRYPYNTQNFQFFKYWAFTLNAQLDLTQTTFDAARNYPKLFSPIKNYNNPFNYWMICMQEYRREESVANSEPPENKEFFLRAVKNALVALKKGKPPKSSPLVTDYGQKIFEIASALKAQGNAEVAIEWERYTNAFEEWSEKTAPHLLPLWIEEEKLLTREKRHPMPYVAQKLLEDIERYQVGLIKHRVGIITVERWSDQLVSLSEAKEKKIEV